MELGSRAGLPRPRPRGDSAHCRRRRRRRPDAELSALDPGLRVGAGPRGRRPSGEHGEGGRRREGEAEALSQPEAVTVRDLVSCRGGGRPLGCTGALQGWAGECQ